MKLDILAFGAHPDDVELGCGGTLIVEKNNGKKVGIIDLTQGELGTRGSATIREQEAKAAQKIMGVAARENLNMGDGFFEHTKENLIKVITRIRYYQPTIVFANAPEDRHPDHGKGNKLVTDALFLSGLKKIETTFEGQKQVAWRPNFLLYYIQGRLLNPNFYIDISEVWDEKQQAIFAYASQFYVPGVHATEDPNTYISKKSFMDAYTARLRNWGNNIGTQYAEGFISVRDIGMKNLDFLIHTPF